MAKTRARAVNGEEVVIDAVSDASYDLEQNILAALNSTDDDVKFRLHVHKVSENNAKELRIGVFAPTDNMDALLDEIAVKKGEGTYRFRLYRNNVIVKQTDMDLTPPLNYQPPQAIAPSTDIANAIASAMKGPMDMIAGLITKLGERAPQEKSDITELVQALGTLDGLRGTPTVQQPAFGFKDMMELFKQGMEFAKDAGGGDRETTFLDLAGKLIEKIDLEKLAQAYTAPVPTNPALAAPTRAVPPNAAVNHNGVTPPSPPTQEPAQTLTAEQQAYAMMQHNIKYLTQKAAQGGDPELYAEWVLDNVPTEIIEGIVAQPNAVEILQRFDPNVGAHADWFHDVLENVRQILTEDGKEAQSDLTPSPPRPDVSATPTANAGTDT